VSAGCSPVKDFFDRVSLTSLVSKVWPLCVGAHWIGHAQSRIAVGSAASYGVSILSSKLFPSILT
jgi:hypothetical protein